MREQEETREWPDNARCGAFFFVNLLKITGELQVTSGHVIRKKKGLWGTFALSDLGALYRTELINLCKKYRSSFLGLMPQLWDDVSITSGESSTM